VGGALRAEQMAWSGQRWRDACRKERLRGSRTSCLHVSLSMRGIPAWRKLAPPRPAHHVSLPAGAAPQAAAHVAPRAARVRARPAQQRRRAQARRARAGGRAPGRPAGHRERGPHEAAGGRVADALALQGRRRRAPAHPRCAERSSRPPHPSALHLPRPSAGIAACLSCSCKQRRALRSGHAYCLPGMHATFLSYTATTDPPVAPAARDARQGTRALRHRNHRARRARARRAGPRQSAA